MKRRFLSTLMALCLALSLIPTAAYATGDEGTDITSTETDVTTPVTDPESTGEETPSEETTGEIMDASALLQAVESSEDATELTLGADITLSSGLAISNNKVITLDLNGKTLDAGANVISVTNGSKLTIEDRSNGAAGKISAQNQIEVESASLVLNSGAIEITGTSGQSYGVFVSEGGSAIVNGGTITSNYAPLGGNNTTGDMNFEVHGGTLTAKNGPAIYMPGQVKLDITGGTLNGGVSLRMGQVTISGGTINAATGSLDEPSGYYNYSGNAWLPDALYVFNGTYTSGNATYGNSLKLDITGGTFNCTNGQGSAVAIYDLGKVEQNSEISISGSAELTTNTDGRSAYAVLSLKDIGVTEPETGYGVHSGKVSTAIKGGQFSTDVSDYVAPNYECKDNGNGAYTVQEMDSKLVVSGEVTGSGDTTAVSGTLQGNFSSNGTIVEDQTGDGIADNDEATVTNDVTVNLTTTEGTGQPVKNTTLNVTAATAASLAYADRLTVQTDVGSVSFDNTALNKMGKAGNDISIQVKQNYSEGVLASYTVTAWAAGGSDLLPYGETGNGTVTITVDKPEGAGENFQVWYVDGGVFVDELSYTDVGSDGEKIAITIGHLSDIVMINEEPDNKVVADVTTNGGTKSYSSLDAALSAIAENGGTLTLRADASMTKKVTISKDVTIIGNNHTITGAADDAGVYFEINNGTFDISDVTLDGFGYNAATDSGIAVIKVPATANAATKVIAEDVDVTNFCRSAYDIRSGSFEITGGTIDSWTKADTEPANRLTKGIMAGLGTSMVTGTISSVTIKNSASDYNDWSSGGIEVYQNADVTITDCTITDVDNGISVDNYYSSDASTPTGATVQVSNTNISATGNAVRVYGDGDSANIGTTAYVSVTGGSLTGDIAIVNGTTNSDSSANKDAIGITGAAINGSISNNNGAIGIVDSTVVNSGENAGKEDGVTYVNTNVNGTTTNTQTTEEAMINGVRYATLEDAIAAAKDGDVVVLLNDVTLDGDGKVNTNGILTINDKDITIEGNGKTIKAKNVTVEEGTTNGPSMINIEGGAKVTIRNLTIDGEEVVDAGETADNTKHGLNIYGDETTVTVENVTIRNGNGYGLVNNGGQVTVNGLTTSNNSWGGINVDTRSGAATLTIENANIGESNSIKIENTASGSKPADPTVEIKGGTFQYVTVGEEIDEDTLPLTISGGKFATGTYDGAVNIADYLAADLVVDGNGNVVYRPSHGGNTGSSGSSDPTYSPKMEVSAGGKVTVNPRTPEAGDKVTITVTPDAGYMVDDVRVTARNGRDIDLTSNGNGTYTFTQPAGQVVIEVTFVRSGESAFFTDVPASFWAYDEIAWAYDNGYVNGTSSTTFSPNSSITRQQVWMILARLSGSNPASMAAAREWAMVNDISDGTNPGNAVTRQQLVALLYRYAQMMGYDNGAREALTSFPDAGTVSGYAQEPMQWSVANGIVGGTSQGTLNPTGTATRAQFAAILYRFWSQVG